MKFHKFIIANLIFCFYVLGCILEVATIILLIIDPILCLCISEFNGFQVLGEYFYTLIFVLGMFPAIIYSLPKMIKNFKKVWDFEIVWHK